MMDDEIRVVTVEEFRSTMLNVVASLDVICKALDKAGLLPPDKECDRLHTRSLAILDQLLAERDRA